jgi:hypothetical protein
MTVSKGKRQRGRLRAVGTLGVLALWLVGCTLRNPAAVFQDSLTHYQEMASRVEYPDVRSTDGRYGSGFHAPVID